MPDQDSSNNQTPPPEASGEKPLSLREVAEQAWDEVVENAPDEGGDEVDSSDRPRDAHGRFIAKDRDEPGEAEPPAPSPDDRLDAPRPDAPTQPQLGEAVGAPAHWSASDKDMLAKAPPEMQAWALRRHSEMESDYQRRVQANAQAVAFVEAVAPVFSDPDIARSLAQNGVTPLEAIGQWAEFHRMASSPDPRVRLGMVQEIARRVQVDPAALAPSQTEMLPPGITPQEASDPSIKWFANYLGKTTQEVQALRGQLQGFMQADQQRQQHEAERVTRWGIEAFANEKGPDGRLLRPHFDRVIGHITTLFRANPQQDLREAYEIACRMDPAVNAEMQREQISRAQKAEADKRAAAAARQNVRGRTTPVTNGANRPDGPRSLRDVIEASADEIGF